MKKILITGKNSYIGTSVEKWLLREPDKYTVDTLDMKDGSWRDKDFSQYDVVFHVAGIAHIKETKFNQELYFNVNRDLAFETAKKAKSDRVKQFIFLSSMSVYGIENGVISKDTPLKPKSAYGKSKLEAEESINKLQCNTFSIAILRPPMVYGRDCKGNYSKLAKLALMTPIFPRINNKRSMIYIDNLSEFVKHSIDKKHSGIFFPQNLEYVNTSHIVELIAKAHGKKIILTNLFNPILSLLKFRIVNKVLGDLVYEKSMSDHSSSYAIINLSNSILDIEV